MFLAFPEAVLVLPLEQLLLKRHFVVLYCHYLQSLLRPVLSA